MDGVSGLRATAAADAYAREVKEAGAALRRAALEFLAVAERGRLGDGGPAGFHVIPASAVDVARLRELAELSCALCFKETVEDFGA
jgi:hypothetical protein